MDWPSAVVEVFRKHGDGVGTEQLSKDLTTDLVLDVLGSDSVPLGSHLTASIGSSEVRRDRSMLTHDATSHISYQSRAGDNTLVIRDSVSAQMWRQQLRTLTRTSNLPTVLFQLPELSSEQNRSTSALADSYHKACGCTSGSFFMSATVMALIVSYFVSGGHLSDINLTHVISFVAITTLGALSGKLLGLVWARWRLLNLATNIYAKVVRTA